MFIPTVDILHEAIQSFLTGQTSGSTANIVLNSQKGILARGSHQSLILLLYIAGLGEHSSLEPTNPYSAAKAGAEMMCKAYMNSFNMPIIVTRGNNVYGPHQFPEKLVPKFTLLASLGRELPIHGMQWLADAPESHPETPAQLNNSHPPGKLLHISYQYITSCTVHVPVCYSAFAHLINKRFKKFCSLSGWKQA